MKDYLMYTTTYLYSRPVTALLMLLSPLRALWFAVTHGFTVLWDDRRALRSELKGAWNWSVVQPVKSGISRLKSKLKEAWGGTRSKLKAVWDNVSSWTVDKAITLVLLAMILGSWLANFWDRQVCERLLAILQLLTLFPVALFLAGIIAVITAVSDRSFTPVTALAAEVRLSFVDFVTCMKTGRMP